MMPYQEQFPKGTKVKIADRAFLDDFKATWKYHHPLTDEHLRYAGARSQVKGAGFYHGGDVLYQLEDVPGTWHEACLRADP
jgi:hypothetical protein